MQHIPDSRNLRLGYGAWFLVFGSWYVELEPLAIVIRCFLQKGFGCVMLGKPL